MLMAEIPQETDGGSSSGHQPYAVVVGAGKTACSRVKVVQFVGEKSAYGLTGLTIGPGRGKKAAALHACHHAIVL